MLDECYYGNCGTVAADINVSGLTTEKILAACGFHYIEVPRTPRVLGLGSLPEEPPLHESDICDPDQVYIVAGFGVVAGKEAYARLKGRSLLKWVDKFKIDEVSKPC